MNKPRIVTSCRGRFHIFDQARELARRQVLHQLITDYPKSHTNRFDIPKEQVRSLLFSGVINHGLGHVIQHLPTGLQIKISRWVHDHFSKQLAKLIPKDTQFFIGLSSFCLEALQACNASGVNCAVDHGSLHQRENKFLLEEESKRWSLPAVQYIADWVIDKEEKEFETADYVFVLSTSARDSMLKYNIPNNKIFINPCGVSLDSFYPQYKTDSVFRVIQVGTITVGKGVLTLLDAFNIAALRNAELWFVGAGLETSGMNSIINKMAPQNVTFHQSVPQSKLRNFYNQSSVFVLASVADGFGMVVAQAMACGLPVIVTENVGAKDLVIDGVNGFIVPVGRPDLIAERLRFLEGSPLSCIAMGQAAQRTVENGYTWQDYGDRLFDFLTKRVST